MSRRYRWVVFRSEHDLKQLAASMQRDAFVAGRNWGFQLHEVSDSLVTGRHVLRKEVHEEYTSPLGEKIKASRVEFAISTFRLSAAWPVIEVSEPPRTLRPLLNQLLSYTDFEAITEASELDLRALLKEVSDWSESATPTRAKTVAVPITNGVVGVVEGSGTQHVVAGVDTFLNTESVPLASITMSVRHSNRGFTVAASRSGSLKLTGQYLDRDVDLIRKSVLACIRGVAKRY